MYQYNYNEYIDKWWYEIRELNEFRNVAFPIESELTNEILERFNITRHEYVPPTPPPPTLEEAKSAKKEELKNERDNNDYRVVTTNIGTFDFDTISQDRINNAITITTGSRNWTLADGTTATVTKEDLLNVIKAGAERSDRIHNKWLELEAQVEAATTVAEVEAIKWEVITVD